MARMKTNNIKWFPTPYRFLTPGLICFFTFLVLPMVFTILVGFTNLSTGHMLRYSTVRELLLNETYIAPGASSYHIQIGKKQGQHHIFLRHETQGDRIYYGTLPTEVSSASSLSLKKLVLAEPYLDYLQNNFQLLSKGQIYQLYKLLHKLEVVLPSGVKLKQHRISVFSELQARYQSLGNDQIKDNLTKVVYVADFDKGYFVNKENRKDLLSPGFVAIIGLNNFKRLYNDPGLSKPFLRVFVWTVIWAFMSVFLCFTLGLIWSLVLNQKKLRFRVVYRMLLIIPYSIPFFISVLIFQGLLNKDFGIINSLLDSYFALKIPWLSHAFWAKVSCLLVNMWLGFPYMLLVITGVLQSIPST